MDNRDRENDIELKPDADEVSGSSNGSSALPVVVERCGIARHRSLKFTAIYKRVKVKLSTKFRVWPFAGDDTFIELDPSEWRKRYRIVEEFKTNQEQRVI